MKKLSQIRLNIKIYTIWRLQFLGVLLINHMRKKIFYMTTTITSKNH